MGQKKPYFDDVPPRMAADELEREILDYWDEKKIYARSLEQTARGKIYTFYDGPPYATGKPHYGHILQSAIKDTVLRYKTMQGYHVPRRVGWDCHGLPVETLVEKELGFKSKKDIEKYGIEKFNQKCRDTVFRYIDDFTTTLKRIGRWADYDQAYATLDRDYMESEWWAFKRLWEKELVYKDFRSTPYCIRCATPLSNFEVTSNYHDRTDTAVYVLLKVNGSSTRFARSESDGLYLAIWTTTPWTLPGNVAVAINPELEYVSVDYEGKEVVVAKQRIKAIFGEDLPVKKQWSGSELDGLTYEPLYNFSAVEGGYKVVYGGHVTGEDGTGLVHIATAFGEEDAELGKKLGLPVIRNVDSDGRFTDEVKPWAGEKIFAANDKVTDDLRERGLLLKAEQFTHSYPYCWRCDEPLIYYALDTWFIKVTDLKKRMLEINEQINWTPKHVKHGRFAKGIESAPDWAVSRNRFWSVPVPIWECDKCGERVCAGSLAELAELSGQKQLDDMHRPYVDEVTWSCTKGEGKMKRVEEVLDVWFDSAAMPYSQWHYPFANKEFVEKSFPADFIAESVEQTRAWFYVMHVLATALTKDDIGLGKDKPAYKNVIGSGLIFAEDGQKLSKKLKNYPEPEPTIAKYGADVLRFYLLAGTSLGEPYRFSEKEMQQVQRGFYLTLWNAYSFFVRYANTHDWQPGDQVTESSNILDKWIRARLVQLENEVVSAADDYQIDLAARAFTGFVDDLSNWYIRRSRGRFQRPASDKIRDEAFGTLHEVLVRCVRLLAAFMPFVTENIYRNLTKEESVHLSRLPVAVDFEKNKLELLEVMKQAREAVSAGLAIRAGHGIKVRQPLNKMMVMGVPPAEEIMNIIKEEVNVKNVEYAEKLPDSDEYAVSGEEGKVKLALDIVLTEELKEEGRAREIIRRGQVLRREAGYALDDRIKLVITTSSEKLRKTVESQKVLILDVLQADEVMENGSEDAGGDFKVDGEEMHIGVMKGDS
ncbi:MAG: isoleucine--tRNA ligase [Candidatus Andersenbacteria bacterium]|nr:isoleucine--tRNA ligase [bacterium]MDZ4225235.1 isoleucine--tRNA ligase [Candidatus Andersenbacteria bacterium]